MRTTLDLPDDLLRRAKIAAVERGTTLRALVGQALANELGTRSPEGKAVPQTRFPIFTSKSPGTMNLNAKTLAELDAEEDACRHARAD